jgi:hypothetical protein
MEHAGGAPASAGTAVSRAGRVRVREAMPRDLDAVVMLRLALLREHPDHPIYGRLRADVGERARGLFATQLRSTTEAIFLGELDGEVAGVLRCV